MYATFMGVCGSRSPGKQLAAGDNVLEPLVGRTGLPVILHVFPHAAETFKAKITLVVSFVEGGSMPVIWGVLKLQCGQSGSLQERPLQNEAISDKGNASCQKFRATQCPTHFCLPVTS